jgi:hypothetical protein
MRSPKLTIYWSLPLLLTALQGWVSWQFCHEIRGEELAESVRNVYWLEHRLLYDGVSSNVGWYATLMLFYRIFGFSLYSAKIVRLILWALGLFGAADILREKLGPKLAWAPLLLLGLSPTLLYFGAMQTSFGVDIPYAAICLWLLLASLRRPRADALGGCLAFACGFTAMLAALSYPGFLFYFPSLALVALFAPAGDPAGPPPGLSSRWNRFLFAGAGAVLPLALALWYLAPATLLIYDPATRTGVFRGGGQMGFDPAVAWHSLGVVRRDLFVRGESYYFELSRPDFSGFAAVAALGWIGLTLVYMGATGRINRLAAGAALLLLVLTLVVPNLSINGLPGLRRCTGVIAASVVCFALVWQYYAGLDAARIGWRRAGLALCLLLPLSQAFKIAPLLADAAQPSRYRAGEWFALRPSPTASLAYVMDQLGRGQILEFYGRDGKILPIRYQEIYAAVAGTRLWNHQPDLPVWALDWRTGQRIALTPACWTNYYFPH